MIRKITAVLALAVATSAYALPPPTDEQALALKAMKDRVVTICIFDPVGANGPAVGYAKDYMLEAKKWGINAEIKAYTDERVAAEDLKAWQCDAAAVTTLRAKQFNKFVGSLDAVGAIPNDAAMRKALATLTSPSLAPLMREGQFEVVGVIPLGAAYVMVRDRAINSIEKAAGKRVAVMEWDKSQAKMVQRMGAQPVASDIINFVAKFNNGQVDIIGAPAAVFKPLELHKGLGSKGAIVNYPILQVTGNLIIRPDKFPAGYGQKSREWVKSQLPRAFGILGKMKSDIPQKYWMQVPSADKPGYQKLMRESRVDLTKRGIYDKRMMKLLWQFRCKEDPKNFECSLQDENYKQS